MELEIILEQEEDGTYSVHCPALKGCHSQGATKEEVLKNIPEAIQLYLEVANEKARRLAMLHSNSIPNISIVIPACNEESIHYLAWDIAAHV